MTWSKFGAEFPAEARSLSSDAYRLLTETIMYSNHLKADLILTRAEIERGTWVQADLEPLIAELLASGWWERDGQRFFVSARFPEWQRSSEQVEAKRRRDREAQQRRRERQKDPSVPDSSAESASLSARSSERNGTASEKGRPTLSVVGEEKWPALRLCSVCAGPMDAALEGDCHPTCEAS